MNVKKIIKVLPAEGSNPEFAPEEELQQGVECYGYVLLTFDKEHEIETALVNNLSLKNIADGIVENCMETAVASLRQAFVVAEGYIKAGQIQMEHDRNQAMERFSKVLRGIDPDGDAQEDFPEE